MDCVVSGCLGVVVRYTPLFPGVTGDWLGPTESSPESTGVGGEVTSSEGTWERQSSSVFPMSSYVIG